jgi:ribosomal protein S9
MGVIHKIGRRKPLLHVYVSEGTGVITVNKKNLYFPTILYSTVMQPMSHDRGNFK